MHHEMFYKIFGGLQMVGALAVFILEIVDFAKGRDLPRQFGTGIFLFVLYLCAAGLALSLSFKKLRCLAISLLVCCAVTVFIQVVLVAYLLYWEMIIARGYHQRVYIGGPFNIPVGFRIGDAAAGAAFSATEVPSHHASQIAIVAIKMIFLCLMFCLSVVGIVCLSHDICDCCHNKVRRGGRWEYAGYAPTETNVPVVVHERTSGDWPTTATTVYTTETVGLKA
jgi:hypothetical protein